jgi:hypothetical protein
VEICSRVVKDASGTAIAISLVPNVDHYWSQLLCGMLPLSLRSNMASVRVIDAKVVISVQVLDDVLTYEMQPVPKDLEQLRETVFADGKKLLVLRGPAPEKLLYPGAYITAE